MIVASFDPGDNTGLIIFDTYNETELLGMTASFSECLQRMMDYDVEQVLVEKGPKFGTPANIARGIKGLKKNFPVVEYRPAQWKPIAKARNWRATGTRHEKDAWNILRYWLFVHGSKDIGDRK